MKKPSIWVQAIQSGLIGGAVSLLLCLVGMVVEFADREIIQGVISMGQILAVAPVLVFAYTVVRRLQVSRLLAPVIGAVSGLGSGVILVAFVALGQVLDLRAVLINASPDLYQLLTFNL